MINKIKHFFANYFKSPEQIYLERSVDTSDLERRMREIERGNAPFQKHFCR